MAGVAADELLQSSKWAKGVRVQARFLHYPVVLSA